MSVFGQQRSCPASILKAYKNGDFTDFTITCGPLVFKVHQLVVCPTCDFFGKSVKFAVGKEAEERRLDLPEDDPEMIRRLISYLYLGDYDPCNENGILFLSSIKQIESITAVAQAYHSRYRKSSGFGGFAGSDQCSCLAPNTKNATQPIHDAKPQDKPEDYSVVEKAQSVIEVVNPLTIHATMYALADKYQVDGLGRLAKEKFESCLHHHANSDDFVNAVQIAYSSTPDSNRGLRDAVVKAFLKHFKIDLKDIPGIETKLESIDELSFLLIKSWPAKTEPPKPAESVARHPSGGLFGGGSSASAFGRSPQPSTTTLFGGASSASGFGRPQPTGGLFGQASGGGH